MKCDFYKKILDESLIGYAYYKIICDKSGTPCDCKYIYANKQYQELIGISENKAENKIFAQFAPKAETDNIGFYGNIALNNGRKEYEQYFEPLKRRFKILVYSPQKYYFAIIISDITNEDITKKTNLQSQLYNEKKLLETTLASVADSVILTDNEGKIIFINRAAEILTGFTQSEAKEKQFEEVFNIVDELTYEKNINIVNKVLNTGKTQKFKNNTVLISKEGLERVIESTASPVKEESGNIIGVILVFKDYTEKRQKQKEIEYLSYHDQLTGLYNRKFYTEELNCIDRKENYPLTVALGDVNGLKLINDSFGQTMGDMLLIKISRVLNTVCRKGDIAARLGGDEFAIVMPKTDEEETRKVLDKIKELVSKETIGAISISIPFGYEIKRSENEEMEKVIKKAEDYMYKKKISQSPSIRGNTINAIISALYEKNRREEQHSHRVSELCKKMGIALNMNEYKVEELKTVGLLHDIGKIAIDDNILNKPGKLSSDEWVQIRRHPEIGFRILNTASDMSDVASYVLFHHERWDGGGYPKHIKGSQIPVESRIIAIADTYDAMTSDRSYRSALPDCLALQELKKNAGFQFDPELVNVFIEKVLKTK